MRLCPTGLVKSWSGLHFQRSSLTMMFDSNLTGTVDLSRAERSTFVRAREATCGMSNPSVTIFSSIPRVASSIMAAASATQDIPITEVVDAALGKLLFEWKVASVTFLVNKLKLRFRRIWWHCNLRPVSARGAIEAAFEQSRNPCNRAYCSCAAISSWLVKETKMVSIDLRWRRPHVYDVG